MSRVTGASPKRAETRRALMSVAAGSTVMAVALALRLLGLDRKSVWFDEAVTFANAVTPWPQVLDAISQDVHPPLSYVLFHVWPLIGAGDFWLRLPSAVFGALAALVTWAWARRIASPGEALLTGLLVALMPLQVDLAQEARMYGLLLLLTAASLWLLDCLVQSPTPSRMLAYALVATAMLYTHYFAPFVLAAEAIGVLLAVGPRRQQRQQAAMAIAPLLLAGLAFVPWLPVLSAQAAAIRGDYWIEPPRFSTVWLTFRELAAHTPPDQPFRPLLFIAYALQAGLLLIGAATAWQYPRQRVAVWLLIVPIALAVGFSIVVSPIYAVRYVSPIGLAFAFLLARGAFSLKRLGRAATLLTTGMASLAIVLSLWWMYFDPGYSRADLRAAARLIQAQRLPDEVILHLADFTAVPFTYYGVAAPDQVVLRTDDRSELCDALRSHSGGWLVTVYAPDNPLARDAAEAGISADSYAGALAQQPAMRLLGASVFRLRSPCNV